PASRSTRTAPATSSSRRTRPRSEPEAHPSRTTGPAPAQVRGPSPFAVHARVPWVSVRAGRSHRGGTYEEHDRAPRGPHGRGGARALRDGRVHLLRAFRAGR